MTRLERFFINLLSQAGSSPICGRISPAKGGPPREIPHGTLLHLADMIARSHCSAWAASQGRLSCPPRLAISASCLHISTWRSPSSLRSSPPHCSRPPRVLSASGPPSAHCSATWSPFTCSRSPSRASPPASPTPSGPVWASCSSRSSAGSSSNSTSTCPPFWA